MFSVDSLPSIIFVRSIRRIKSKAPRSNSFSTRLFIGGRIIVGEPLDHVMSVVKSGLDGAEVVLGLDFVRLVLALVPVACRHLDLVFDVEADALPCLPCLIMQRLLEFDENNNISI